MITAKLVPPCPYVHRKDTGQGKVVTEPEKKG